MKPIYDTWDLSYKSIFGAVRQFETVRFSIRLSKDIHPDFLPVMVLFRTGFKERFLTMHCTGEEEDCFVYSAEYNARYTDVHYYYFSYTQGGLRHYIKKTDCHYGTVDTGDLFQLTVLVSIRLRISLRAELCIRYFRTASAGAESSTKMCLLTG